ncbi:hypothetical protein R1sor_026625 [Riccia sorocarpa]|uniref:F-box domain-containing protein n=1 Tax=Riccia sorocarpa TaxID=122646 RepID=A0ABD3GDL7_9MARC
MERTHLRSCLWENLPSDLLGKVLAKLPISALMNFSRVCKRWECYIMSAEFARRCHSVQPVLVCHYPGGVDIVSGKWISPYLAIPSTKSNTWEKHTLDFVSNQEEIYLVAVDHGLICFKTVERRSTLFVYNPLTRQFKKLRVPGNSRALPGMPDPNMLVGLMVDQETGNYKLVVGFVESNVPGVEEPRGTHVFDSLHSIWTSTSVCPNFPTTVTDDDAGIPLQGQYIPGVSVRSSGNFYWLVDESNGYQEENGTNFCRLLLKYDTEAGSWTIDELRPPYELWRNNEFPSCLPHDLPYTRFLKLLKSYADELDTMPQWNFHLSTYKETVFMTLFDSLIRTNPYSGEISPLIPEVKVIEGKLVREFLDRADAPRDYLPTKAVARSGTWYVAFEYHGFREPYQLPELHAFTATFRAFV